MAQEPKLLAEWFWVDRWDGSSAALLPMEAQGVYRAMLSQGWRRGARLPADLAQVQRAIRCSGEEWARSWPLIQSYWRVDGDALVNDTQLEVYAEAIGRYSKRVERAKAAADARWNASGNAPGTASACAPEVLAQCPPSPSPSPEKKQNTATEARKAPADAAAPKSPKAKWVAEACDDWNERYGPGSAPGGRIGNALKPIVQAMAKALAESEAESWAGSVRPAWRRYLAETTHPSPSAQDFAQHFADWTVAQVGSALVPSGPRRIPDPEPPEPDPRDSDRQADELARRRRNA